MKTYRCDWCSKSIPQTREHSIQECDGQIEWQDWLDTLEENRFDFYQENKMNDQQLREIVSIFGNDNVFLMDEKMIISPVPKSILKEKKNRRKK